MTAPTPIERQHHELTIRMRAYREALKGNLKTRREHGGYIAFVTLDDGTIIHLSEPLPTEKDAKTASSLRIKKAMPALARRLGKTKKLTQKY